MQQGVGDLTARSSRLLTDEDAAPVIVQRLHGASPLLVAGDHAGREIPVRLRNLGLSPAELDRHIAWDIGVAGLGEQLARRIDATFVRQRYSRLVIDCNRTPGHAGSIAEVSDGCMIAGNQGLTASDREAREQEVFRVYHEAISDMLEARRAAGRATVLLALHSFTPSMDGADRPWRFGVLHRGDSAFSNAVLAALRARWGELVGDNEPYSMDGTDFTVPHHADSRGLDYLELEVRQDTIDSEAKQAELVEPLAEVLHEALAAISLDRSRG